MCPCYHSARVSKTGSCSAEGSQRLQLGHSERSEEASLYHSSGEIFRSLRMRGGGMATSCSMAVFLAVLAAALSASGRQPDWATGVTFAWQPDRGVVWQTPVATVYLDRSTGRSGPALHFAGTDLPPAAFVAEGRTTGPGEPRAPLPGGRAGRQLDRRVRRITLLRREGEAGFVEQFTLTPAKTINADLEIERPFSLLVGGGPCAGRSAAL